MKFNPPMFSRLRKFYQDVRLVFGHSNSEPTRIVIIIPPGRRCHIHGVDADEFIQLNPGSSLEYVINIPAELTDADVCMDINVGIPSALEDENFTQQDSTLDSTDLVS